MLVLAPAAKTDPRFWDAFIHYQTLHTHGLGTRAAAADSAQTQTTCRTSGPLLTRWQKDLSRVSGQIPSIALAVALQRAAGGGRSKTRAYLTVRQLDRRHACLVEGMRWTIDAGLLPCQGLVLARGARGARVQRHVSAGGPDGARVVFLATALSVPVGQAAHASDSPE